MSKSLGILCSIVLATLLCSALLAEEIDCDWQADRSVAVVDGWIEVGQGRDENAERARIAIWGPERATAGCEQLDNDPELEVFVTSRGAGSGPYYRLQIVDFRGVGEQGTVVNSYGS